MDDLQHIIPDRVRRHVNLCDARRVMIGLVAACAVLAVLTITFASLYGAKHVETIRLTSDAASSSAAAQTANGAPTCWSRECLNAAAWMGKNMKPEVDPCDDFYKYACGAWAEEVDIPPEKSYFSVKYKMMTTNEERLRDLVESKIVRNYTNSSERKLKEFFMSCIHDFGRYKEGGLVLVDVINQHLGGWYAFDPENYTTTFDLTRSMTVAQTEYLVDVLFGMTVYPDWRNMDRSIINVRSGGLGMYYSYYYRDDKTHLQEAYKDYMWHVAHLLSWDANVRISRDVIKQFVDDAYYQEYTIAQGMKNMRRSRNWWRSSYTTIATLRANYSQIPWMSILRGMYGSSIYDNTDVYIRQTGYFEFVNQLLANETENKTRIMNNYIVWRVIDEYAHHLSWDYKYAGFLFYEKYTGQDLYLPTWEHCLGSVEYRLGPALAAEFLHKHVGEAGKRAGDAMVRKLRDSLVDTIDDIPWMDNTTKSRAKLKLQHVQSVVGFPEQYFDYSYIDNLHNSLVINQSLGYFRNLLNINNFTKVMQQMELNSGKDFQVWMYIMYGGGFTVSPQFYHVYESLVVPAGAMQMPQYYRKQAGYVSFASLGSLIAEELAKPIGPNGRYSWYNGSYYYWWTSQTTSNYTTSKTCLVDDITKRKAGPFLVDGENVTVSLRPYGASQVMSDIMGLRTAYKAYLGVIPGQPVLPALNVTNEQQYFLSAAQTRCIKRRKESAYTRARIGYLPDNMQINIAFSHMQEFSDAFQCPKDAPMNPPDKCHVF